MRRSKGAKGEDEGLVEEDERGRGKARKNEESRRDGLTGSLAGSLAHSRSGWLPCLAWREGATAALPCLATTVDAARQERPMQGPAANGRLQARVP